MSKIPDAWDDDWESTADKPKAKVAAAAPTDAAAPKLSKAQRRAQHLEQQKQLWDSAENPDRFHWLETQGVNVPLKQEFKPQVKLLSRKPTVPVIARNDGNGMANLSLDDGDSDEESRKQRETELEERRRRSQLEMEEKQRKYAEARERIMGSPSPAPAPAPPVDARNSSQGRDPRKPRGKLNGSRNSQPTSSADQSPARPSSSSEKQLFDPEDMSRRLPKREVNNTTPKEDQPARQPRGPENNGRGGFGFAARGGKTAA